MLRTFSTDTAYSMAEVVPPVSLLCGGTTLPTLRKINKSPGSEPVTKLGSMRESEQVINKVSGDWPSLIKCSNRSLRCGYILRLKLMTPRIIFSTFHLAFLTYVFMTFVINNAILCQSLGTAVFSLSCALKPALNHILGGYAIS